MQAQVNEFMFHVLRKHGISAQIDETIVAGLFDASKVKFVMNSHNTLMTQDPSDDSSASINGLSDNTGDITASS